MSVWISSALLHVCLWACCQLSKGHWAGTKGDSRGSQVHSRDKLQWGTRRGGKKRPRPTTQGFAVHAAEPGRCTCSSRQVGETPAQAKKTKAWPSARNGHLCSDSSFSASGQLPGRASDSIRSVQRGAGLKELRGRPQKKKEPIIATV